MGSSESPSLVVCLDMERTLQYPNDPQSYAGGSFTLLEG